MKTWVALLRGINVGGNNKLPMVALIEHIRALGGEHVATYNQSGNAVFQATIKNETSFAAELAARIEASHQFSPAIMLIPKAKFEQAAANNPFATAETEPKTLHLFFCLSKPAEKALLELARVKANTEELHCIEKIVYLYAPDGIGRSKLVKGIDRVLQVDTTARNWRTVCQILEMLN